jgi:L-iditol 2-dehydrogenase
VRVAELVAPKSFALTEAPIEPPAPGEVQVRVTAVGVCGSDLHAWGEGGVGGLACVYPMVLGHEPAGEIVALGAGVTGWRVGDRVSCAPAIVCHHCAGCMAGRHNLCRRLRFLSQPREPGFLRERVNLPAENVLALPRALSDAEGALVEPLAVGLHAIALAGSVFGADVVVFGAGPIGLLTIAALRVAGARRVWAIEPLPHRRELAVTMGAHAALAPGDAVAREVGRVTAGEGVAVAFDCATMPDTTDACLSIAAPGGRVVIVGIPSQPRLSLDPHLWRRKELDVLQVRRSNGEEGRALALLTDERRRFAPLVTHRLPLASVADAFALAAAYADGVGKLIVSPAE